jgi:hypothetical protein
LGDTVAALDVVGFASQIEHDDADFAAVSGINGGGAVGKGDGVLEGKSAAGAHLGFEAGGDFDGNAGRHGDGNAGLEGGGFDGSEVHAGVLVRSMGVGGELGVGAEALEFNAHSNY